ncbi:helix-turn-helix domain-containing protein [Muriicola marianensis]|uniref:Transcriptional regulator n=1 Tax=Muriicola marianensis TaxID=1324801 RepID=A0ABQ1QUA4_9FLAO|nr:AraC family transcriptional regulator [Muriicola marianensis]GGD43772.1 transcriptional regulator [Muriicola marianensis]
MFTDLDINFQILLDAIGLIQGVTIGILLMVMGLRKYRRTFYLGLFLLFYSLELGYWIAINTRISSIHPECYLLPLNFTWILFPLFYIYTQQVSVFSDTKIKYWLLAPGVLSILVQVGIYTMPYETRVIIKESFWHELIFWILGTYFSWGVGIWNLRLLYKHRVEVLNTYSFIEHRELQWARFLLIYLLFTSVFSHIIAYVFPNAFTDNSIFSVLDLIAIYWVSYYGITQRNVRSLFSNTWNPKVTRSLSPPSNRNSDINIERLGEIMDLINRHIRESNCFINPDLTIMDLADGIDEHPKLVSEAINSVEKQNFNSYINQYRIRKAEDLLKTDKGSQLSVEGIGTEVGFKSKSAFYSAFKKFTGTTPTQYRESRAA